MTNVHWQERIPQKAIISFRNNFKLLTEILPRMKGTLILSKGLLPYLKYTMKEEVRTSLLSDDKLSIQEHRKELLNNRARYDPLIELFKQWAEAELKPIKNIHAEFEGKILYTQRITDIPKYRDKLGKAIKDITSLIANKITVEELALLASHGDEKSLMKLIKLDKIFLTAKFAQDWIWIAQNKEDRRFFKNLSNALLHDTYREHIKSAKAGIACYLLWFLGFNDLPNHQLLEFIKEEKIVDYEDIGSFNKMLNRIGLKKDKQKKKKSKT